MATKRGLILVLSNKEDNWAREILEKTNEVVVSPNFQQAVKMLNYIRCDLILIDTRTVRQQALEAVQILKHNFPHFPVAVFADTLDNDQNVEFVAAGADLLVTQNMSPEELTQQVRIVLQQNVQRRALLLWSQKLYMISSLPLLLRDFTETRAILQQAGKIIINLLGLEAIIVAINDDGYRLYTAVKPLLNADQFVETTMAADDVNPVTWTIRHRMIQVYNDVGLSSDFPITSDIDNASEAVIVPFLYADDQYGAFVFLMKKGFPIVNEEIFIFEQFAVQVESVLLRTHKNALQERQLMLNRHIVDAWSAFADVHLFEDVIRLLCEMLSDIEGAKNIVVSCRDPQTLVESIVDNCGGELVNALQSPDMHQLLHGLESETRSTSEVHILDTRDLDSGDAKLLSELFDTSQFVLLPITVSGERLGMVLIALKRGWKLDPIDQHLVENVTQIAVNTLQSLSLRDIVLQHHSELMAMICSITEGVFYVSKNQEVTFYNPQLPEIAAMSISDWVNQDVDALLQAIAKSSMYPAQVYNQLHAAQERVTASNERDYPIVTVPLADSAVELNIEFVRIDNDSPRPAWLGVVHPVERPQRSIMLERALERVRVTQTTLRSAINTLAEQHGHFSFGERDRLLGQIKTEASTAGVRWSQFSDLYNLYFGGFALNRASVSFNDLIERALRDERLIHQPGTPTIHLPVHTPTVQVDEFHFTRAVADLLTYFLESKPSDTALDVKIENHPRDVNLVITSTSPMRMFDEVEEIIFNPNYLSSGKYENLGLYIAIELIRRNGAHVTIQRPEDAPVKLQIVVPLAASAVQREAQHANGHVPEVVMIEPVANVAADMDIQNSAPSREPESIMLIGGDSGISQRLYDQLENEGFTILSYDTGAEALPDVNATYFDLIIIDTKLEAENGFNVCERVRKRTEAPIILVADNATPQEKVHGLQVGADDFVTEPVSDEELLARVHVIVNRRYLAARSSEPMLFGDLYVDFARRAVFLQNQPIELTRIEYDILYTLIINRGQTVTHKQLLTQVWGPEYQDESQYLWVNISRLRKKLSPTQDSPRYIHTQSGVGYYFASS